MTVMGGVRVLQYGYPKVHDGKNVFYDLLHSNTSLGIDKKTDAYIGGANWGQYYFATLGIKLAELSDDIFTKTAIIRTSFALIGLTGLALLAFLAMQLFHTKLSRTGFLIFFVFLEVISVPLVLHLREARYYPLAIFFTALVIFVYTQYRILKKTRYVTYSILLTASLFLLFVTFSPVYFIFLPAILLYESVLFARSLFFRYINGREAASLQKDSFKNYLSYILPLIFSAVIVSPLLVFFKTFYIAGEMAKYNTQAFLTTEAGMLRANFELMWKFFAHSDFIYLAIFLKVCLLFCFLIKPAGKSLTSPDRPRVAFSNFLTVFFILYFVFIARIPNLPFTRYFIPLQPVLALIVIMDIAILYTFLSRYESGLMVYSRALLVIIVAGFIIFNISYNANYLKGHLYEITHQYRGPLDYVIPFIKEKYGNTGDLVIATNYEEPSYMYYLDARVVIGYVGNNLEEDIQTQPDIIVYRKLWQNFGAIFADFLQRNAYERVSFPVYDYSVNNIPELNWRPPFHHRFRTFETSDEQNKVDMFVRK